MKTFHEYEGTDADIELSWDGCVSQWEEVHLDGSKSTIPAGFTDKVDVHFW